MGNQIYICIPYLTLHTLRLGITLLKNTMEFKSLAVYIHLEHTVSAMMIHMFFSSIDCR